MAKGNHRRVPRLRRRKITRPSPGAMPGTLMVTPGGPETRLKRIVFGPDTFEECDLDLGKLEKALKPASGRVVWLDVQGLGDAASLQRIGDFLGIHPLTLEDIAHVHQRPKVEEFEDYLFMAVREIRRGEAGELNNEQISFVLKERVLVTFQETYGDGFEPVRKRLRESKGAMRTSGADYLTYALLDTIIDNYFPVLELYEDSMEQLDIDVREHPSPGLTSAIHGLRRELRALRRAIWPLRDVVAMLTRQDTKLMHEASRVALRDCYDHVVQLVDFVEGSRERSSDLADLYLAVVSEKTNQIMKLLTMISTIFIPLTFLGGVYGMNFDPDSSPFNMPELRFRYGYLTFWLVCLIVATGMTAFFFYKGWLGKKAQKLL